MPHPLDSLREVGGFQRNAISFSSNLLMILINGTSPINPTGLFGNLSGVAGLEILYPKKGVWVRIRRRHSVNGSAVKDATLFYRRITSKYTIAMQHLIRSKTSFFQKAELERE